MLLLTLRYLGKLTPTQSGVPGRIARPLFKLGAAATASALAATGAGATIAASAPSSDEAAAEITAAYMASLITREMWLSELRQLRNEQEADAAEQPSHASSEELESSHAAAEEQVQLVHIIRTVYGRPADTATAEHSCTFSV